MDASSTRRTLRATQRAPTVPIGPAMHVPTAAPQEADRGTRGPNGSPSPGSIDAAHAPAQAGAVYVRRTIADRRWPGLVEEKRRTTVAKASMRAGCDGGGRAAAPAGAARLLGSQEGLAADDSCPGRGARPVGGDACQPSLPDVSGHVPADETASSAPHAATLSPDRWDPGVDRPRGKPVLAGRRRGAGAGDLPASGTGPATARPARAVDEPERGSARSYAGSRGCSGRTRPARILVIGGRIEGRGWALAWATRRTSSSRPTSRRPRTRSSRTRTRCRLLTHRSTAWWPRLSWSTSWNRSAASRGSIESSSRTGSSTRRRRSCNRCTGPLRLHPLHPPGSSRLFERHRGRQRHRRRPGDGARLGVGVLPRELRRSRASRAPCATSPANRDPPPILRPLTREEAGRPRWCLGHYFLGRRSDEVLSDPDLVAGIGARSPTDPGRRAAGDRQSKR